MQVQQTTIEVHLPQRLQLGHRQTDDQHSDSQTTFPGSWIRRMVGMHFQVDEGAEGGEGEAGEVGAAAGGLPAAAH